MQLKACEPFSHHEVTQIRFKVCSSQGIFVAAEDFMKLVSSSIITGNLFRRDNFSLCKLKANAAHEQEQFHTCSGFNLRANFVEEKFQRAIESY